MAKPRKVCTVYEVIYRNGLGQNCRMLSRGTSLSKAQRNAAKRIRQTTSVFRILKTQRFNASTK